MKKTIKNIIIVMAVAMLFISCNADLASYGKGIFESMMTSAPNADYTIKRFAGIHGNDFIVETEAGIATLSKKGVKTTLIEELHPEVAFATSTDLYYKVKEGNKDDVLLKKVSFDHPETQTVVTMKNGEDILYLQKSFYENENYYLLLATKNAEGKLDKFYISTVSNTTPITIDDNVITFSSIKECNNLEGKAENIAYIGNGYYRVKNGSNYNIYDFKASDPTTSEVKIDGKAFSSLPMAVEGKYLFLQDGKICTIEGTTATVIPEVKHTINYIQTNNDVPMVTVDSTIYGCYGAKPFTFNGTKFSEHEAINSGVVIIDLIHDNTGFYAFSAENGLYISTNGTSYTKPQNN